MRFHLAAWLGIFFGISELIIGQTKQPGTGFRLKDRGSFQLIGKVIWLSIIGAIAAANLLPAANGWYPPRYYPAGVAIFIFGIALRWYSIWILGRFFTVKVAIASDHRLVET